MPVRRSFALLAAGLTAAGLLTAVSATAAPAAVPTTAPPIATASAANTVRATALPTAQIDGIAYTQVIVKDTVYVGGNFTLARPAGVAPGGPGEVARSNLLAYSLSTGRLRAFAPFVNNTVKALAVSPDGTRLYAGGLFTAIDGVARYRIASFDTATGSLVSTFRPIPNYVVQAIVATDTTVYFGGKFGDVGGVARGNLAAVAKDTGALLPWAPVADASVQAMVLTPDGENMVLGGNFATLNSTSAGGLGSVRVLDGATVPFAANQVVHAYGNGAAFLALASDGRSVFATAYSFTNGNANFEGTLSADPDTGAVNWLEDCHGDTYGVWSSGTTVYTVGHAHFCGNIGGFPQVVPSYAAHRAVAFTAAAAGTVQPNTQVHYANLAGNPAPSLRQWFPDLAGGTVSGADQAAWTVTGNSRYLVLGGEFPRVNGIAQQGLVRFAMTPISPDTLGPTLDGGAWTLSATATDATSGVQLSFPSNWDRDDYTLRYRMVRDTGSGTPATTIRAANIKGVEWRPQTLGFTDTAVTAGTTYRYRVSATDSSGNVATSQFVTVTVPAA